MGRRGGGGRRRKLGTQLKFKKSKRKTNPGEEGEAWDEHEVIFGFIKREHIIRLAEWSFEYMSMGTYAVGGIQFHMEKNGKKKWVRGSVGQRIFHYIVTSLVFITLAHKFWMSFTRFRDQDSPDVLTVMCMSLFMIQFVGVCMGLCMIFSWREAIEVLNSWKALIAAVDDDEDSTSTPYDAMACTLKVINCAGLGMIIGVAGGLVTLLFPTLPVCFYPMVKAAGMIPETNLPEIVWQLVFFPLDFLLGMIAMFTSGLAGMVLAANIGVQRVCTRKLRKMTGSTAGERQKLEMRYMYLQLYHRSSSAWWNWCLPYTLFSLSATIIVAFFITIRQFGLPWYLYPVFPISGAAVSFQVFGTAYDVIMVKQESEEVVENLRLFYRRAATTGIGLEETKKLGKRSQALAPLPFNIAGFANYNWDVPLAAWDEILNQLLFLLNL